MLRQDGLHKTHPGFAIVLVGMIILWGGLGLISGFAPPRLFPSTGALRYVNALPRIFWFFVGTGLATGMAVGGAVAPTKPEILRNSLALAFPAAILRGCLTAIPALAGQDASLNALPIWFCLIFVHFACLLEPFKNPLTDRSAE